LESLLYLDKNNEVDKTKLNHQKWFRNYKEGTITVEDQKYTLRPTNNKRELIIKNNKIVNTKPYIIEGKDIKNDE
jgi:hypothetical protein